MTRRVHGAKAGDMVNCSLCHKRVPVEDTCSTLVCRACHKSISFEDCINDVSVNALRAQYGLKPVR